MSLYNLVHGVNPLAGMVLAMLGTSPAAIPRFRDAYYDAEHQRLCIHTRTGGGNREEYEQDRSDEPSDGPMNDDLRLLPGFIKDEDDDYDCTYATFYFKVPAQFAWFKDWAADKGQRPPGERWAEVIEHIRSAPIDDPVMKKFTDAMAPLFKAIESGESGGVFKV